MAVVLLLAASKLWGGVGDGTTSPVADRTDAKLAGRARAPAVNDNTFSAVAERFNLGSVLRRVAVNNTVVVTTASKDFERYVVRWCDIAGIYLAALLPQRQPPDGLLHPRLPCNDTDCCGPVLIISILLYRLLRGLKPT